ncbi:MAG: MarR family transcriptional regulator [Spirochaetaceae bacterium]|nr:MarR family transcriptional regulator [Spirochaetaceae bacterium]
MTSEGPRGRSASHTPVKGGSDAPGAAPAPHPQDRRLLLEKQLCFPFYAVSRLITRAYQGLLEPLGLTYPQYLVMLALWEADGVPVQHLSDRLLLNTNTLTPLLKRLESSRLITRRRDESDERVVIIRLTEEGRSLKKEARRVPEALVEQLLGEGGSEAARIEGEGRTSSESSAFSPEQLLELRDSVKTFLAVLKDKAPS